MAQQSTWPFVGHFEGHRWQSQARIQTNQFRWWTTTEGTRWWCVSFNSTWYIMAMKQNLIKFVILDLNCPPNRPQLAVYVINRPNSILMKMPIATFRLFTRISIEIVICRCYFARLAIRQHPMHQICWSNVTKATKFKSISIYWCHCCSKRGWKCAQQNSIVRNRQHQQASMTKTFV